MTDTAPDPFGLDLEADRQARAAHREGRGEGLTINLGGGRTVTLPSEMPLDVLSPLRNMDEELAMMLRALLQAARAQSDQDRWASTEMVVDLLAVNPTLPTTLLDTLGEVVKSLFGEEGYQALMDARLSREDVAYLAKGVFRHYGLTLGEASPPSGSQEGDSSETSSPTSSTTTDSTPEESGADQEQTASSVSAGS